MPKPWHGGFCDTPALLCKAALLVLTPELVFIAGLDLAALVAATEVSAFFPDASSGAAAPCRCDARSTAAFFSRERASCCRCCCVFATRLCSPCCMSTLNGCVSVWRSSGGRGAFTRSGCRIARCRSHAPGRRICGRAMPLSALAPACAVSRCARSRARCEHVRPWSLAAAAARADDRIDLRRVFESPRECAGLTCGCGRCCGCATSRALPHPKPRGVGGGGGACDLAPDDPRTVDTNAYGLCCGCCAHRWLLLIRSTKNAHTKKNFGIQN